MKNQKYVFIAFVLFFYIKVDQISLCGSVSATKFFTVPSSFDFLVKNGIFTFKENTESSRYQTVMTGVKHKFLTS